MIDFSSLTIPTPGPYQDTNPHRQRENLCYVLLQILGQLNTNAVELPDIDVVKALKDLQFNHIVFDLGAIRIILDGRTVTFEEG